MALKLGNFIGFETGGGEEALAISQTPAWPETQDRGLGSYILSLDGTAGHTYKSSIVENGSTDEGNTYVMGFYFRSGDVSTNQTIVQCRSTADVILWEISLTSDGRIQLEYESGPNTNGGLHGLSDDIWYKIEVAWNNSASGAIDVHIDDSSRFSETGKDMDDGNSPSYYQFGARGGQTNLWDDLYSFTGGTGTGDFLGEWEIKKYQAAGTGFTQNNDDVDTGSWANVGETPGNDDNMGIYTGTPKTGTVETNGSTGNPGPDDDSDVDSGTTIHGAKWLHRFSRGGGGGTTHSKIYGNNVDTLTTDTISVGQNPANFLEISEAATEVPLFDQSFEHGGAVDGAQNLEMLDIWAFLLFTPAAGAPFPPFLMRNLKTPIYRK